MKLREWMSHAMGSDLWSRMERTQAGAFSRFIDDLLYSMCDENRSKEGRGTFLSVSNGERFYHGVRDEWPKWDGRDGAYCDVRKTLREIQYLLEAYAFAETNCNAPTNHAPHYCRACGREAP